MAYECSVDYQFGYPLELEARDSGHADEKAQEKFNEMTSDGHNGMIRDMFEPEATCWEV